MTRQPDRKAGLDAEVAVVGYGPVGMVVAALLGRRGHSVVVLERYPGLYNLPRAGVFDDETMRTLAALGIAEQILPNNKAPQRYWFQNGDGQRLMEFDLAQVGRSGWARCTASINRISRTPWITSVATCPRSMFAFRPR